MSIIRIFANDIELNFKKDSLTLKKENNALSQDFKVTHSSFPFLIIEDESCKKALGSADITSTSKRKVIPVTVIEFGVKFYGELQQISVQKGYRKCNLKYSSDLLLIMNKKISEFMPIVSVIPGETNPVPYSEQSETIIDDLGNWETFPVSMIGQIFPDVKFQFPTMYWKNKYGVDLEATDKWSKYKNHINLFGVNESEEDIFIINTGDVDGSTITINQPNVPAPQVFLLSPLHYIFEHLGWKTEGSFLNHELIKRTLMLSMKDNLTNINLVPSFYNIIISDNLEYDFSNNFWRPDTNPVLAVTENGKYKIMYEFEMPPAAASGWLSYYSISLSYRRNNSALQEYIFSKVIFYNNGNNYIISGELEFDVNDFNIDTTFYYTCSKDIFPINYSLKVVLLNTEKEYSQMHPTIELGRYVPDWTVGNYLNYVKNQFNLDITLDDFKKTATFNLNESLANSETPEILDKSLVLKSFELAANSSFVLKYENDEDEALFITRDEVFLYDNQDDDFTKKIETKFKIVPRNGYTSELSEALEDKEGIGLMIYEPINAPYTSETTINGFNLSIPGEKGIYETFFRRWLKFRLTASRVELEGQFTEIEISKIYKAKSIYIDNQRYRIESLEYNETTNNYYDLKMKLESVNY